LGFGSNRNGQLGIDISKINHPILIPNLSDIVEISTGGGYSLCLDSRCKVWAFGDAYNGRLGLGLDIGLNNDKGRFITIPTLIPNLNDVIQIAAGYNHSLCLDKYGRVWSFGYGKNGELGLIDKEDKLIPTLIPNLVNIIQVNCGNEFSICLDGHKRIWGFGRNRQGQLGMTEEEQFNISIYGPVMNPYLTNIISVSCGALHTLCIKNEL
jgi:alpha-tubulin suppressor-like RCC1 family protein